MKLSLKEFFVHEAKSSGSDKKSSINIDVKSSAQVNIKEMFHSSGAKSSHSEIKASETGEKDKTVSERALSSYKHPRTHLHNKFAKNPDIDEPWALAQAIASKNEGIFGYEPGGVEIPDDVEDDGSGFAVVRDDGSVRGVFPSHEEAVKARGSTDEIVPASSLENPQNMDKFTQGYEGSDDEYDFEFPADPERSARNPHTPGYKSLSAWNDDEPIRPFGEHNDPTEPVDAGATILSDPTQPAQVKKFKNVKGNLHIDLCEMFGGTPGIDEMGGPGSGRKKGSKNKPKSGGGITAAKPVDPKNLPDDPNDFDIDVDDSAFTSGVSSKPPEAPADIELGKDDDAFARTAGDLGDESDLSWLDDPSLGKGVEVPKQEPKPDAPEKPPRRMAGPEDTEWQTDDPEFQAALDQYDFSPKEPKDKGKFWQDVEAEDGDVMSWEELEAAEPEIAADIAREYPDLADPGHFMDDPTKIKRERNAFFTFDKQGDLIGRIHGGRYKWDFENGSWIPMDDGESPSGEF